MTMKQEKQKLFRITIKRDILLGRASSSVESTLKSREDSMRYLPYRPNLTSEERFRIKTELLTEIDRLQEARDILTVIRCHTQPHFVESWSIKERGWRNEWDVPMENFERAIHTIIELMEAYKSRTNNPASRYDEPIQLLLELLDFRKAKRKRT